MTEQRKYSRYIVEGMGIYAKTLLGADIEVIDISAIGASIRSSTRFSIGREYIFKFEHKERVVSVKGIISWSNLTGSKKITEEEIMPIYTSGIEFRDFQSDKAEEIKRFVSEKITELRERLLSGVRLKIDPHEKGVFSYLETCVVKDISIGGMRIETEYKPSVGAVFPLELVITEDESSLDCRGKAAFYFEVPDEAGQRYSVGVEFMDMNSADKLRLQHFINTLHLDVEEM